MTNLANLLPNLIIPGAAKSGTSTLFHTLRQHDQIFGSTRKETRFFINDEHFSKGLDWYAHSFFSGSDNYPIRMEATPAYLPWSTVTSRRIKTLEQYTKPKFLVIFREPVARAYSHYWMKRGRGKEKLSFEEAVARELNDEGLPAQREKFVRGSSFYYLLYGNYASLMKPFLDSFGRSRFLFVFFEDLLSKPRTVFAEILTFLQINTAFEFELQHKNKASRIKNRKLFSLMETLRVSKLFQAGKEAVPSSFRGNLKKNYLKAWQSEADYPAMADSTKRLLKDYYKEEIISLQKITGRDLSHWYGTDA